MTNFPHLIIVDAEFNCTTQSLYLNNVLPAQITYTVLAKLNDHLLLIKFSTA